MKIYLVTCNDLSLNKKYVMCAFKIKLHAEEFIKQFDDKSNKEFSIDEAHLN